MKRQAVVTTAAPAAIGPYSQAIHDGEWIFCSGQLGLDPASGQMVTGGITDETEQAIRNLASILNAAGSGLDRVVKTTVFLTNLADFQAMNEVYSRYFTAPAPARSTIQVAALPRGGKVEIEAIALKA